MGWRSEAASAEHDHQVAEHGATHVLLRRWLPVIGVCALITTALHVATFAFAIASGLLGAVLEALI